MRVFISYAHDDLAHQERVREFWSFLRSQGVDAQIDLIAAEQRLDWAQWMSRQIRDADHVLVVASPEYKRRGEGDAGPGEGRGVQWEARLIREVSYASQDTGLQRVLPVVLPGCSADDIPLWLAPVSVTHYVVSEYTVPGAEALLRLLTRQPGETLPPLGEVPVLAPRGTGGAVSTSPHAALHTPAPAEATLKRVTNLPPRSAYFTGRDALLQHLATLLDEGPTAVVALRGMGGAGKTQLTLEYAHQHYSAGKYGIVWWIRAEHPLAMHDDLIALGIRLGLGKNADIQAVMAELSRRSGWLLIYDNATGPESIKNQLPSSGHIIVTSRSRAWSHLAKPLDIGLFTPFESEVFLRNRTGRHEPEVAELAEELGHLPLALAQAASYCDEHQLSIAGYLRLFRSPQTRTQLLETGLSSTEYPDSVATTWLLHVVQLRKYHPSAFQLLRICAFLTPDYIQLHVLLWKHEMLPEPLASAASRLDNELAGIVAKLRGCSFESREEVIGELVKTGLLSRQGDEIVSVHRLVQAVTRQEMGSECAAAWRSYTDLLVHALHPYPPFPVAKEYDPALTWLRIQGTHLAEQFRESRYDGEPPGANRFIAFTDAAGKKNIGQGMDVNIITDYEYAYECRFRLSQAIYQGSKPAYPALALANLGYVRFLTGRYSEAAEALADAIPILEAGVPSMELDSLRKVIGICQARASERPAEDSQGSTIFIIEESADLNYLTKMARDQFKATQIVPVFYAMIGQNEIPSALMNFLGHDSDGLLPLPFLPLWNRETRLDTS